MAGKYRAPGAPSLVSRGTPEGLHAREVPRFGGTPLTVGGITREAMGSSSLLGASIPKGLLAAGLAASHGAAANDLAISQSDAQVDIGVVSAQLEAVSVARALRSSARDAEAVPATSSPLSVQSPRLLAHSRGPRVVVKGLVAGELARTVAMFARYGYTIERALKPTRLDPMTKMSYWQTDGCTIVGAVPQEKRQTIAQAFDSGVTIWTRIADIGTDVTATNAPRAGIAY